MTEGIYTKTSKKVTCIYAGSSWYELDKEYTVYTNPAKPYAVFVQASDGFFDNIYTTVSKFKETTGS